MPFLDSLDIANRGLDHLGQPPILTVTEDSRRNQVVSAVYDKVRRAELRASNWKFATRRVILRAVDSNTLLLAPNAWSQTETYTAGAVVSDVNNQFWLSRIAGNIGNSPGGNNSAWESYFGPMTMSLYDSTQSYSVGELVYELSATSGKYTIYRSLQNNNANDPGAGTAWSSTTVYQIGALVTYLSGTWRSLVQNNLNVTPATGPLAWDPGATYASGQQVTGSDSFIYTSAINSNTGNNPVGDSGAHWTNTGIPNAWALTDLPVVSAGWLPLYATASTIQFEWPIGTGPSDDPSTGNVFRLPAGFIKKAPSNPKAGSVSWLGAPTESLYDDWLFEGNFLVTSDPGPIMLRFIADIQTVANMDDMFCEGLACRIAVEACEPITQSTAKIQTIESAYKDYIGRAKIVNAIETGAVEPPLDDFIACRL